MGETVRGGPADGATVTENALMLSVGVMPPGVPGAAGGVVLGVGYPQMKVETLLDHEAAYALAHRLLTAASQAKGMESGILRAEMYLPNGFDPKG